MKTRIFLLVIFTQTLLITPGCWDYIEYEEMTQIHILGIDINKSTYEITVTIQSIESSLIGINSSIIIGDRESKTIVPKGTVHSATDITMIDALAKLQQGVDHEFFYGYLSAIIMGEDAAKLIMKDTMENLNRTPLIRTSADLIITSGLAQDLIKTFDPYALVPAAKTIEQLLKSTENTSIAYPVSIREFEWALITSGIEPVATNIISTTKNTSDINKKSSQFPMENIELEEGNFRIEGMAIFKEDILVEFLDAKESLGLSWITGPTFSTYKSIIEEPDADTRSIRIFSVKKLKSKIAAEFINDEVNINLTIKLEAELRKNISDIDIQYLTPELISGFEKEISKNVKSEIELVLEKCQKVLNTDIFGFGFAVYKKSPKQWHQEYEDNWDEIFPELSVNISVESKIIDTGANFKNINYK